jgi:hypothetical protein
MMHSPDLALLIGGGFAVGILIGISGVGAGSLMTPWLITVMRVRPEIAVGTDLLFAGITKALGARAHANRGHVNWPLTIALVAGSVPTTLATITWMRHAGHIQNADAIRSGLAIVLVCTALLMVLGPRRLPGLRSTHLPPGSIGVMRVAITVLSGAALGVAVSLTSVGAGALAVTALALIHPYLPTRQIVGSDVAHAVPLALLAGGGHASIGNVDFELLFTLLAGSLPGIVLGCRISTRVPEQWVRRLLSILLIFAAWRLTQK